MVTMLKADYIRPLSVVCGNPDTVDPGSSEFPHVVLTRTGQFVENTIGLWQEKYPQIDVDASVVMPDHVHLCITVTRSLPQGLSRAVANFMGMTGRARMDALAAQNYNVDFQPFFKKGFNDRIAYDANHYLRQLNYIADNPRRYLIKRYHRDLYRKKWLVTVNDETFMAVGNILLLSNPDRRVVRFSRRYAAGEFERYEAEWHCCVENGGVLVSPFIHPKEEALKEYAFKEGGSVIRICENGFEGRFAPYGSEFDYMGTGHLLLVAPMVHNTRSEKLTYTKALQMNTVARRVAAADWLSAACKITEYEE